MGKMYLNSDKTDKNLKKPVETEENRLTKRLERLKVNCGTVLRTRMNTEDSRWSVNAIFGFCGGRASDR
jgi:hypothetical protein